MNMDGNEQDLEKELQGLRLLLRFAQRTNEGDIHRVVSFALWLENSSSRIEFPAEWKKPLGRLARWTVGALGRSSNSFGANEQHAIHTLVHLVARVATMFPDSIIPFKDEYYAALSRVIIADILRTDQAVLLKAVTKPLEASAAYDAFVSRFLTVSELDKHLDLEQLSRGIDSGLLTQTVRRLSSAESHSQLFTRTAKADLLWLLAYIIYVNHPSPTAKAKQYLDIDFTASVSTLLSYLSDIVGQRPDIHNTSKQLLIPKFVQEQIDTLINQDGIQSLLALSKTPPSGAAPSGRPEDSAVLASYALTLLQVFPRRSDDIRMWLYMGSMSMQGQGSTEPAIKYFWKAVRKTLIYRDVHDDTKKAIQCLNSSRSGALDRRQEADWRKILLFLELYTFVLKVMDDEEFMTGAENPSSGQTWTRQSALLISDVTHLTTFLKHFAFAMYWHSSQILESHERVDSNRIASYFGRASVPSQVRQAPVENSKLEDNGFAGISGMTLDNIKGMVTGLLRMLYERDSRRNFIQDKNHWLMKEFQIDGFISAVVEEQAIKSEQQDENSDEDYVMDDGSDDELQPTLVGTGRTQQVRRREHLRRQQQRESKRRQLQTVTPRLEILQNMPFFIPFATRVEIFRQFVHTDQFIRRGGHIDPDQWRMAQSSSLMALGNHPNATNLGKHSAKVRRDHVFDDAYDQFNQLGDGLKEPIQITFVDQFDTVEAGIDGGGVTKEFLTSVTNEAFTPDKDFNMFTENEQHLLYPNPSAVDEKKELLKEFQINEGSSEWNNQVRDLLKKYEFLGRVVGKCLYEGILVDIHFAPFFLVKWALTGGAGAATNESGYRANINDLRDLDEGLYQGLVRCLFPPLDSLLTLVQLQLKNYPGNVEDFSLDFTLTDVISRSQPPKVATRELRPGGSSTPVTNQNRLIYISSVARYRLQVQPELQTRAFLRGLGSIIQPSWLSMFNQSELQTLLGGDSSEIDVDDLRRNTLYGGVYSIGDDGEEHPSVKMFWDVMYNLGDQERRKVLKYVTSTPRGPLLGFGQLNPRFSIRDSGADQSRLPSTSTCVNLLKLPIYWDKKLLKEKLLYAVNSGAGFNLS